MRGIVEVARGGAVFSTAVDLEFLVSRTLSQKGGSKNGPETRVTPGGEESH